MKRVVLTPTELFTPHQISQAELQKHAVYVCETCLRGVGGSWVNSPVAVFYNTDPALVPEGGSRWFGLFFKYDVMGLIKETLRGEGNPEKPMLMITNAISATLGTITGLVADNGDVIYSHYRHDHRTSPDNSVWIDGGRDYTRMALVGEDRVVKLQIIEEKLVIVE